MQAKQEMEAIKKHEERLNNLESFNSTLAEIQQAINDFFKNRK